MGYYWNFLVVIQLLRRKTVSVTRCCISVVCELVQAGRLYRFLISAPAILLSYLAVSFPTSASYLRRYRLACRPTRMYTGAKVRVDFQGCIGRISPLDSPLWILSTLVCHTISTCIYVCVYWMKIKVCLTRKVPKARFEQYKRYISEISL